jgi:hypothetical protein
MRRLWVHGIPAGVSLPILTNFEENHLFGESISVYSCDCELITVATWPKEQSGLRVEGIKFFTKAETTP